MSVSLARLVVTAVRVEGRTKAEVARDYRVSRQWVHELVRLFDVEGDAGLEPRSRRGRVRRGHPRFTRVLSEACRMPASRSSPVPRWWAPSRSPTRTGRRSGGRSSTPVWNPSTTSVPGHMLDPLQFSAGQCR